MARSDFLTEEEVVVDKIDDGIPTDDFVSISHPKQPKQTKKPVEAKPDDNKLANIVKLLGDLSPEELQKVITSLRAAKQTPEQPSEKENGDAQKPVVEAEQPKVEIVPAEEKARFSFDEKVNNDVPVVVEIVDDNAARAKCLATIRAKLHTMYDKCVQTKKDAEQMKNPDYKRIFLNAVNARMDFIHYVLLKTTDDDWLLKTTDSIFAMYKAEVAQFLREVDTYPLAIGCPKDLSEYISRRYIVDYFHTKRVYVEAVNKCPGIDFDAKLKVFKHDAYQEPKTPLARFPFYPNSEEIEKPISRNNCPFVEIKPVNRLSKNSHKSNVAVSTRTSSIVKQPPLPYSSTEVPGVGRINNLVLDFANAFYGK